ncbi:TPR-like protein [Punctularia strigosozonata HHB-11173 SS5]|uniref:TPR-like protein n=1 Tax=Punctularia strigosozonata (strain HHB-11173) TaxID=741275 RepID=R7S2Z4_PUNST|nr:TPR-like protein [Punctularia strigosozonata HHB-11173 SS5]EIN03626.1 TPR-like protein [Punctularia strigosozonata HHB-11173 SS5]
MQPEATPAFVPHLCQRFSSLIWSCVDAGLHRSAIFYAERYFALDQHNHDARHLYATALFHAGLTQSALCVVNVAPTDVCQGCHELKAKCCTAIGRYRQARESLEASLRNSSYVPSPSMGPRTAAAFPEEGVLHCRAGQMALKGHLPDQAAPSFRQALTHNPMLWEAFEGLCATGLAPEVDELFPTRPPPVKQGPPSEVPPTRPPAQPVPVASGAGFFTPAGPANAAGNLFLRHNQPLQPFRMTPGNESLPDNSIQTSIRPNRIAGIMPPPPAPLNAHTQPSAPVPAPQPVPPRPLSSADETGPVTKRLRQTSTRRNGQNAAATDAVKPTPPSTLDTDDTSKKARARPALTLANIFSSSGRRSQPKAAAASAKNGREPAAAVTRRSTRLLNGGSKPAGKTSTRRRPAVHGRTRSNDTEGDEELQTGSENAYSPSPPAVPHSEESPAPTVWTTADEQAAQDAYLMEQADLYIYDLMRLFARATRALAMYDTKLCLQELEKLPAIHQRSPWVMSMVGKAHYERADYASSERAFQAVRTLEPFRLWDMDVYSTLLWHLQKPVQLSFLAQELIGIDPRAPQTWIAVGNCFSLQKERAQALTCFRRAVQLDPGCAYAHALSGHETLDENVEEAMAHFQAALRADSRHYSAWYGLGSCYLKTNKLRMAEYHYQRASDICPGNAVMVACLAICAERRHDTEATMRYLNKAIQLSPENALARYRRAKMLISMKRYQEAITDLEHLHDSSPGESNVVFQLAKVYRLIGDALKAAQLLAVARDLEPKSVGKLQKLLETEKDESQDHQMDVG